VKRDFDKIIDVMFSKESVILLRIRGNKFK